MDMLFSHEDLAFREEVRAFFKENLPETVREVVRRTPSYVSKSDMVAWHKALLEAWRYCPASKSNGFSRYDTARPPLPMQPYFR